MNKKSNLITILKGLIIGGTMMVPGVSGGSMAMILGIYDRLVSSVSSFGKNKKENFLFLILFVIGSGAGMLIFAKPLLTLIEWFPKPMLYFFIGAVAGGVPMIYKKATIEKPLLRYVLYVAAGVVLVMAIQLLPTDMVNSEDIAGILRPFVLTISGVVLAAALVLPGISVSYLLLVLGLYERTVEAVSSFDILYLIPLALGMVLGIILVTKLLENAMTKSPQPTYLIILGFIIGSVVQIFPGLPNGLEWIICIGMAVVGFLFICKLSEKEV